MLLGGFAGVVGMGLSMVIRLELSMPGNTFLEGNHHLYNAVVTAHGLFMGLLFFIVSIIFTKYFSKKNFILIIVTRISFIFTFLITFTILLSCGLEFFTRSDNRYAQSLFLIFIFLFATF
jgi:heme/copper-type cytochrome/quinol oxidase subunit 1